MNDRGFESQYSEEGKNPTSELLDIQHQINQESLSLEMESINTIEASENGTSRAFNPISQMPAEEKAEIASGGAIDPKEIADEDNPFPLISTRTIKGWSKRPALEIMEDHSP